MDKLAYHLNKKKQLAKTEGQFRYYYPCQKYPDVKISGKGYVVVEVNEQEWEALSELDRLEYNNTHKYKRHTTSPPDIDEDFMNPKDQEKWLNKDSSFTFAFHEKTDKKKLAKRLTPREQEVVRLCIDEDRTQAEAAMILGVTQGFVSATLKKAAAKLDDYDFGNDNTPDEIVWKCWNMFLKKGKMPLFYDVQLEYVLLQLIPDIVWIANWFYSLGELCRFALKYYLFDEEKIEKDIAKYKQSVSAEEWQHCEDYYGDKPPLVQTVFVRLCMEIQRRRASGLHQSDKMYYNIVDTANKIASKLHMSTHQFFTQRFYPFFANWRNTRARKCYKVMTGQSLPK